MAVLAVSAAFPAACTAFCRDSVVGGGRLMFSCNGFWASGWGVRERSEPCMAEETGLTCCSLEKHQLEAF